MLKKILLTSTMCLSAFAITEPAIAQETLFDADATCATVMSGETDIAALWAFGYLSRLEGENIPVTEETRVRMLSALTSACDTAPDTAFSNLVAQALGNEESASAPAAASAPAVMPTGAPTDEASQALLDFLATEGASLSKLLVMLKPSPEDVSALFAEPLASELNEMYVELFGTRLASEGFPEVYKVGVSSFTTTGALPTDPLLDEIAGGFQKVAPLYLQDVPFGVVRMEFTEVDDSMKLQGFVYVNGHWVLMMSPWRAM